MIIKEISSILDRQCIFSFAASSRVEEFLLENGITSILRIRVTKDGGFAIFNFENEGLDEEEVHRALKEYDVQITSDSVMFNMDLKGTAFLDAFRALNKVPSVIIDGVIFNGGYYYIYMRFHSVDEHVVGSVLKEKMISFSRFAIRFLGKSSGLVSTFREISAAIPLKYVEIDTTVPPSFMKIANDPVLKNLGVSWIRELKYLLEDEIRAVYYDKTSLLRGKEDWINEISKEDRIYETAFSNPLVQYFINQASASAIVTLGVEQKLIGNTFSIATVVPEMVMPEFFNVLYNANKEFKDWKIDIHYVELLENLASD